MRLFERFSKSKQAPVAGAMEKYEALRKEKKLLEDKLARLKNLIPYADKAEHKFYIHLFFDDEEIYYPGYRPQMLYMHITKNPDTGLPQFYNHMQVTFPESPVELKINAFGLSDLDGELLFIRPLCRPYSTPSMRSGETATVIFDKNSLKWEFQKWEQ